MTYITFAENYWQNFSATLKLEKQPGAYASVRACIRQFQDAAALLAQYHAMTICPPAAAAAARIWISGESSDKENVVPDALRHHLDAAVLVRDLVQHAHVPVARGSGLAVQQKNATPTAIWAPGTTFLFLRVRRPWLNSPYSIAITIISALVLQRPLWFTQEFCPRSGYRVYKQGKIECCGSFSIAARLGLHADLFCRDFL